MIKTVKEIQQTTIITIISLNLHDIKRFLLSDKSITEGESELPDFSVMVINDSGQNVDVIENNNILVEFLQYEKVDI